MEVSTTFGACRPRSHLLPRCLSGACDVPEPVSGASPVLVSFNCSLGELVSSFMLYIWSGLIMTTRYNHPYSFDIINVQMRSQPYLNTDGTVDMRIALTLT